MASLQVCGTAVEEFVAVFETSIIGWAEPCWACIRVGNQQEGTCMGKGPIILGNAWSCGGHRTLFMC